MLDYPKMYETKDGAKAEVREHQLSWQGLYSRAPGVEPIPNIEKVDVTLGRMERTRSSKINEGPLWMKNSTVSFWPVSDRRLEGAIRADAPQTFRFVRIATA